MTRLRILAALAASVIGLSVGMTTMPTVAATGAIGTTETAHVIVAPITTSSGLPIDSHSGTLLLGQDGAYYWYGETYACGFYWTDASTPYCGARVYRSEDLIHWTGPRALFDAAVPYWQDLCMHQVKLPGSGCFRPKVAYNAMTERYVLWINTPDDNGDGYRVLTSRRPEGPFVLVGQPVLNDSSFGDWDGKDGAPGGDQNLFVDSDGAGWLVYNRAGRLMLERLDATYTTGDGDPISILNYPEIPPFYGAEAPAMFKREGIYYITMSLARCPYCLGTGTGVETAPSAGGPWTYVGLISDNSCSGQPNGVEVLSNGTYLYTADQWVQGGEAGIAPRLNETTARQAWTPLTFRGSTIQPINCDRRATLETMSFDPSRRGVRA